MSTLHPFLRFMTADHITPTAHVHLSDISSWAFFMVMVSVIARLITIYTSTAKPGREVSIGYKLASGSNLRLILPTDTHNMQPSYTFHSSTEVQLRLHS